jgi:hypothetical protein
MIAIVILACLGALTGALIWALREMEQKNDNTTHWQPGTKPHNWRV